MSYVATFFPHRSRPRLNRPPPRNKMGPLGHGFHSRSTAVLRQTTTRSFHTYFISHLPSSSHHPDSRHAAGPHHKLPRAASTPHTPGPKSSPAATPPNLGPSRDLTVVRIPIRSAKHHFGAYSSRGTRPYNEDTNQAGTIDIPAFAKRGPISLVRSAIANSRNTGEGINADSAAGDPQVFYFGVFDGHGGGECSEFLRDELHGYIEEAAREFELGSSLRKKPKGQLRVDPKDNGGEMDADSKLDQVDMKSGDEVKGEVKVPDPEEGRVIGETEQMKPVESEDPVPAKADAPRALRLQRDLVNEYKSSIGGYFRRFRPENFDLSDEATPVTPEMVLTYAFLRADLDFVTAQARKPDPGDPHLDDHPVNKDEILGSPHLPPSGHGIGGHLRFKGGSTASVVLISTPTPAPFWHPAANSTLICAHIGDTRILLCETATGLARPLTVDHHPSSPVESRRLTRFAESLVTDSFGEERISGLANSRAFGDMQAKRIGVSAEASICRIDMGPAEYSFLVLMSDGVSNAISDQEIVDIIKEAKTPESGSRDVVNYATEVSADGDNATCLCVRLGGWERRSEGGLGSLATREVREARRAEALDPRRGRT